MDLDIEVTRTADTCIMSLDGEVDVYTSPSLKQDMVAAIDEGCAHMIVDLAEVGFIDSSGLGALVSGLRRMKERSGTIRLVGPREPILKVFKITGLDKVFPIFATVEEARKMDE
jgi:anti-sigma B factor antagonist